MIRSLMLKYCYVLFLFVKNVVLKLFVKYELVNITWIKHDVASVIESVKVSDKLIVVWRVNMLDKNII